MNQFFETSAPTVLAANGPAAPTARRSGCLHLCNRLDPRLDGGIVSSVLGMTGALQRAGRQVRIISLSPSRAFLEQAPEIEGLVFDGPEVDLEAAARSAGVVHLHGLWQAQTRRGARLARRCGVPYVITAHGMAEPWALRYKRWKKRIYLSLVEKRNLRGAACLHALARPEIEHLRALAPWAPVAFVPNGVAFSAAERPPARSVLEAERPELRDKFVLLFFARLHAKKGLDLLAEALGRLAPERPDLHVLLAGNDEGAWAPFRDRMEALGLDGRLTYLGHVSGERARQVWAAADAFILPSHSEGFSMAVLEAMVRRLPTLITTACHFPEAETADAAVVVEPNVEALTEGIRGLLERTPEERARLGETARRLIENHYTWERAAERLDTLYQWLAGGGAAPDFVDP